MSTIGVSTPPIFAGRYVSLARLRNSPAAAPAVQELCDKLDSAGSVAGAVADLSLRAARANKAHMIWRGTAIAMGCAAGVAGLLCPPVGWAGFAAAMACSAAGSSQRRKAASAERAAAQLDRDANTLAREDGSRHPERLAAESLLSSVDGFLLLPAQLSLYRWSLTGQLSEDRLRLLDGDHSTSEYQSHSLEFLKSTGIEADKLTLSWLQAT